MIACYTPPRTVRSLVAEISKDKLKAFAALERVQGPLTRLEQRLPDGIPTEAIEADLREVANKLKTLAEDPANAASAYLLAFLSPSAEEVIATLKDAAAQAEQLVEEFEKVVSKIAMVSEIAIVGIGLSMALVRDAIAEIDALTASITAASNGDDDAQESCRLQIDDLIRKTDFRFEAKKIDQALVASSRLAQSTTLEASVASVKLIAKLLAEMAVKLRGTFASMCASMRPEVAKVLTKLEAVRKVLDAEQVVETMRFAQKNNGARRIPSQAPRLLSLSARPLLPDRLPTSPRFPWLPDPPLALSARGQAAPMRPSPRH